MAVKLCEEIVRRERAELEAGRGTRPTSPRRSRTWRRCRLASHGDLGPDHDRAAAPQHPRPAAGRQPADRPGDGPDRGQGRARLGELPRRHDAPPARHPPAARGRREGRAAGMRGRGRREATAPRASRPSRRRVRGAAGEEVRSPAGLAPAGHPPDDPHAWRGSSWRSTPTTSSSRRPSGSARPPGSGSSARSFYEEGRTGFTIDRLLDAVSQYADAIAQEAQYKTSYNTSIAALDEAKGTLLADCRIAVVEPKGRAEDREGRGMAVAPKVVKDPKTGASGSISTSTSSRPRSRRPPRRRRSRRRSRSPRRPTRGLPRRSPAAGSSSTTSRSRAARCRSGSRARSRSARPRQGTAR